MSVTLLQQMASTGKPSNWSGLHFPSWSQLLQLYMEPNLLLPAQYPAHSTLTATLPQEDSANSTLTKICLYQTYKNMNPRPKQKKEQITFGTVAQ